jgi:hypothetical protein
MKAIAMICGLAALGGTIVPPVLFALRLLSHEAMQGIMLVAAIGWFAAAPFWMKVE